MKPSQRKPRSVKSSAHPVALVFDPAADKTASVPNVGAHPADTAVETPLARRAHYLDVLNLIHRAILQASSSEAIANTVLHYIPELLPCPQASIFIPDARGHELVVLATHLRTNSLLRPQARFPIDAFGSKRKGGNAYLTGLIQILPDIAHAKISAPLREALQAEGVGAVVALPLQVGEKMIGVLHLYGDGATRLNPEELETARQVADTLAIALQNARLNEIVKTTRERLLALSHRQMELEESQRRELARSLHDMIGQNLTALNMNLFAIQRQLPAETNPAVLKRIEDSSQLVQEIVQRIRGLMADLHPSLLDDFGLSPALRWYANEFSKRSEIPIEVHAQDISPRLPQQTETALFRIAQEALTNIAKHAHAKNIVIVFQLQNAEIALLIADDGVGFDFAAMRRDPNKHGAGLVDMRERAEAVGGHLWVECEIGKGTRVTVQIPR